MKVDVIRAWKDPSFLASLSEAERSLVPAHPSGLVEMTDDELKEASGMRSGALTTAMKCTDTLVRHHCCP